MSTISAQRTTPTMRAPGGGACSASNSVMAASDQSGRGRVGTPPGGRKLACSQPKVALSESAQAALVQMHHARDRRDALRVDEEEHVVAGRGNASVGWGYRRRRARCV